MSGREARDRVFAALIRWLSRRVVRRDVATVERYGRGLGSIAWRLLRTERRRTLAHLRTAFPEWSASEVERVGRESFRHLGANLGEIARILGGGADQLLPGVIWRDEERFRTALAAGRGIVLVTAHTGNWELLGASIAARGYPLTVVARAMKTTAMEDIAASLRSAGGMATAVRESPGAAKALLAALRSGGVLGILIDQDIDADACFVPFFGHLASTPRGAAVMALRRGAAFLPVLSRRTAAGAHEVQVFPPLEPTPGLESDAAADELTARATAVIETWIRGAPEQWVWMHRRWKRQPPAGPADAVRSVP